MFFWLWKKSFLENCSNLSKFYQVFFFIFKIKNLKMKMINGRIFYLQTYCFFNFVQFFKMKNLKITLIDDRIFNWKIYLQINLFLLNFVKLFKMENSKLKLIIYCFLIVKDFLFVNCSKLCRKIDNFFLFCNWRNFKTIKWKIWNCKYL